MSRNNRRQHQQKFREHKVPAGGVGLDQVEAAKAQHQAVIQQKVESIAALVYAQFVGQLETDAPGFDHQCSVHAGLAIDAALNFAKEVWGVEGRREKRVPVQTPQPIIDPPPVV